MTVGILTMVLYIGNSTSLKEKRMVLHSLKARIRNNFNLSVAQVADEDKWQKTTVALAGVERDRSNMNSILSRAVDYIRDFHGVHLIDYEIDLL